MSHLAILDDDVLAPNEALPFRDEKWNAAYGYLLKRAAEQGMPVILSNDFAYEAGYVGWGWIWHDGGFTAVGETPIVAVYDKFPSTDPAGREKIHDMQQRGIAIFNHPELTLVVDDKHLNYHNFKEWVPYSHYYHHGVDDPHRALIEFSETARALGFSPEMFVAKPQWGYGAMNVAFFTLGDPEVLTSLPPGEYVLQPFIDSSGGIPEIGLSGMHDLRVILADGAFVTSYIRQPPPGRLVSNAFLPGSLVYLTEEDDLPAPAREAVHAIDARFSNYRPRLYSIDLVRAPDGRFFCFEMNSRPGTVSDGSPHDERGTRVVMDRIVDCFATLLDR
ncbi:MAG: hypothetical protein D6795_03285 [Deltaproteobacteria bacterium]|nr:MAG: hypothetical protein D6795_03285 [Deltaproteobacteria bacterium]